MTLLLRSLLLTAFLMPGWCVAQTNADQFYLSFDIDNLLDLGSSLELIDDGVLSWSVNDGYQVEKQLLSRDVSHRHADLTSIFVTDSVVGYTVDTTTVIDNDSPGIGVVTITPQDIVLDYGTLTNPLRQLIKLTVPALAFSSSHIDALSIGRVDVINGSSSAFLMSLDRTTLLEGSSSLTARPADVFAWEQSTNSYTLLFDSSAWFSGRGMNATAISWDSAGQLLYLSFDTAGHSNYTGSLEFEANSILVYNPENDTLLVWDTIADEITASGLSTGANLDAMSLTFIGRPETIFTHGFE